MKIYIETLGCKVNQFESQAMAALLTDKGHQLCADAAQCDAFILNSCAVTAESGRKSRQAVRRLRKENPTAIGVVCGCYAQIEPQEAAKLGVQLVCGSAGRRALVEALDTLNPGQEPIIDVDPAMKRRKIEPLPAGRLPGRTRALMRIQDGCTNFCTYCVIPYSRGPVRSQPVEECVSEAARLAQEGYKELVITGIEIAAYGRDFKDGTTLADGIEAIAKAAPGVRLRLGSLEPRVITEDFCRRMAAIDSLCDQFHLSLQSGCDRTLKAMGRKYTTDEFYAAVCRLREAVPGCGITTDIIAGFPGETEEDMEETLRFLDKCAFSQMHVFPYSPRPGTPAAKMDGQLDRAEKARRAARISALGSRLKEEYLAACVGKTFSVLFETGGDGAARGHAPNYCEVWVATAKGTELAGKVADVHITGADEDHLWGELVK